MNEPDKSIEADAARFRWVLEEPHRAEWMLQEAEGDPRENIDREMLDEARSRLLVPKPKPKPKPETAVGLTYGARVGLP